MKLRDDVLDYYDKYLSHHEIGIETIDGRFRRNVLYSRNVLNAFAKVHPIFSLHNSIEEFADASFNNVKRVWFVLDYDLPNLELNTLFAIASMEKLEVATHLQL